MRLLVVEDSVSLRRPVVKALRASGFAVDETGVARKVFGWRARIRTTF